MRLKRNLPPMIASAMLSTALSGLLLRAQYLVMPFWMILLLAILFSSLFAVLMTYRKAGLAVIILLLAGAGLFWWLAGDDLKEPVLSFLSQSLQYIFGTEVVPVAHPLIVAGMHVFAVSFLCVLMTVMLPSAIALSVLSFAYIIMQWLLGDEVLIEAAIAAAALLIFYIHCFELKNAKASGQTPTGKLSLWAVPLLVTIIAASYMSVTAGEVKGNWQWYSSKINLINDYMSDYTGFDSPRVQFSISAAGFHPLGDRLGGPLVLEDTPILSVDSRHPVLLRGNIKNHYTGSRWDDTAEASRYRLNNQAYEETRDDVFDLQRPDAELFGAMLKYFQNDLEIRITNLYPTGTTIFTPYRVDNVRPVKAFTLLPFYNDEGEVFSSRNIPTGTSYIVFSTHINNNSRGFPELMAGIEESVADESAEKTAMLMQYYMGLPEDLPEIVSTTTLRVVSGIEGEYNKALAIKAYLEEHFRYTTQPEVVPEDIDFVAYFLETKEGYCTYFASAMAVMARVAGLPSRYVEGFQADANPRGKPQILRKRDAHAWAELYFEGYGWVPFDALQDSGPGSSEGFSDPGYLPEDFYPIQSPSPDMQYDMDFDFSSGVKQYFWVLYVLGALAAGIATLSMLALCKNSFSFLKRKYSGNLRKMAAHYYTETIWLLDYYNRNRKPGQTLTAYGKQTDEWLFLDCGKFSKMAGIISIMVYADKTPTEDEVMWMALFRRKLARRTLKSAGLPRFFYRQAVIMRHVLKHEQ